MPQPNPDPSFESVPDTSRVKLPSTQDLFEFFNHFLADWMELSAQIAVGVGDEIHDLPLERGLLFSRPVNGILVIRSSPDFEGYLRKTAETNESPWVPREVFLELYILFWHRFVSKFWGLDSRKLPPSLFKKSTPLDWPNRESDTVLKVFVANYPLVIRFWTSLTEEEINHWRNPKK